MPKKSNKTAHVLSLLTNGNGDYPEEDIPIATVESESKPIVETSKPEVIVELQDSTQSESLSALVKSDLEKELTMQLTKKKDSITLPEESADANPRPPYSTTFMTTFGIEPTPEKEVIDDNPLPDSLDKIKSQAYVLENFNDEDEEIEPMKDSNIVPHTQAVSSSFSMQTKTTKTLHNLAEDVMKSKAPEIMKNFNMCTCQDCVYDVMALALNNTTPLYTVTEKGELFQKLTSYELQYGTDLTSQITKACIRVKFNPRHSTPNQK